MTLIPDEDHTGQSIIPSPPPAHAHPVSDVTGLTGTLNTLQSRQESQRAEIKALSERLGFCIRFALAVELLVALAVVLIMLAVMR